MDAVILVAQMIIGAVGVGLILTGGWKMLFSKEVKPAAAVGILLTLMVLGIVLLEFMSIVRSEEGLYSYMFDGGTTLISMIVQSLDGGGAGSVATLLELAVVVTIIALAATGGIPIVQDFMKSGSSQRAWSMFFAVIAIGVFLIEAKGIMDGNGGTISRVVYTFITNFGTSIAEGVSSGGGAAPVP